MNARKTAEHISFPLNPTDKPTYDPLIFSWDDLVITLYSSTTTSSLTAAFEPSTDMEKQIAAILQSSMAVEEQGKTLTKAEQLTLKGRACKKKLHVHRRICLAYRPWTWIENFQAGYPIISFLPLLQSCRYLYQKSAWLNCANCGCWSRITSKSAAESSASRVRSTTACWRRWGLLRGLHQSCNLCWIQGSKEDEDNELLIEELRELDPEAAKEALLKSETSRAQVQITCCSFYACVIIDHIRGGD